LDNPEPVTFKLESSGQQLCSTNDLLFQATYCNSDTNSEGIDKGKLNNNPLSSQEMKGNIEKETNISVTSFICVARHFYETKQNKVQGKN